MNGLELKCDMGFAPNNSFQRTWVRGCRGPSPLNSNR